MTTINEEIEKPSAIPTSEWIVLVIGVILFATTECILWLYGYSNLLLNSIASLILASGINYVVFTVKNKIKRLISALKMLVILILSIPHLIRIAGKYFVILLLNLVMIPVLAVYLTIYGLMFSLSGGANKIMFKHYDAFGHKMIAPIEKYLHYEAIIVFISLVIVIAVGGLVLSSIQSASSVTANSIAYNAVTNGVALGTTISYLPVFTIVFGIIIVLVLLRSFLTGYGKFSIG